MPRITEPSFFGLHLLAGGGAHASAPPPDPPAPAAAPAPPPPPLPPAPLDTALELETVACVPPPVCSLALPHPIAIAARKKNEIEPKRIEASMFPIAELRHAARALE